MDWRQHYSILIGRARDRRLSGYSELHHVIPRCLGGDDSPDNLVRLTPEEHFIAHLLLVKMHPGNRLLVYAAELMTVGNLRLVGRSQNKLVGWLKRQVAEARGAPEVRLAHAARAKNDPRCIEGLKRAQEACLGIPRSEHTKAKLREFQTTDAGAKAARAVLNASKKGVPRSEETRRKNSIAHKGRVLPESQRAAISAALKGKPKSAEHAAKVAAALIGKPGTRRGAVTSEETKQKMREAALRRYYPDGNVPPPPDRDPKRVEAARKAWITKRSKNADPPPPK